MNTYSLSEMAPDAHVKLAVPGQTVSGQAVDPQRYSQLTALPIGQHMNPVPTTSSTASPNWPSLLQSQHINIQNLEWGQRSNRPSFTHSAGSPVHTPVSIEPSEQKLLEAIGGQNITPQQLRQIIPLSADGEDKFRDFMIKRELNGTPMSLEQQVIARKRIQMAAHLQTEENAMPSSVVGNIPAVIQDARGQVPRSPHMNVYQYSLTQLPTLPVENLMSQPLSVPPNSTRSIAAEAYPRKPVFQSELAKNLIHRDTFIPQITKTNSSPPPMREFPQNHTQHIDTSTTSQPVSNICQTIATGPKTTASIHMDTIPSQTIKPSTPGQTSQPPIAATSKLLYPPKSRAAEPTAAARRDTILSVLIAVLAPLNPVALSLINQLVSYDIDTETLLQALLLEKIITEDRLPTLRTSFRAVEAVLSGTMPPSATYSKPTPATKQPSTSLQPPPLPQIEENPTAMQGRLVKVLQEYALEAKGPMRGSIIASSIERIAKNADGVIDVGDFETEIKRQHLLDEEDIKVAKLRFAERMVSAEDISSQGAMGSLEHFSGKIDSSEQQQASKSVDMTTANINSSSTQRIPPAKNDTNSTPLQSSTTIPSSLTQTGSTSAPSVPQVVSASNPKSTEIVTIAHHVPTVEDGIDLVALINSWPAEQVARTVLIASGRPIPGEELPRYNEGLEAIKANYKELKSAELTTLEWDLLDPPQVDVATSMRKRFELVQIPKTMNGDEPTKTSEINSLSINRPPFCLPKMSSQKSPPASSIESAPSIPNLSRPKLSPLSEPPKSNDIDHPSLPSISNKERRPRGRPLGSKNKNTNPPNPKIINFSTSSTLKPASPEIDSASKLGKSMFRRIVPESDTHATAVAKPTTPEQTPEKSRPKTTPQVVIYVSPKKTMSSQKQAPQGRITPPAAMMSDDEIVGEVPSSLKSRISPKRSLSTNPLATRLHRTPAFVDLTKEDVAAIPLDATDSSEEEELDEAIGSSPFKPPQTNDGYKSYLCQWQGCQADLHSFETLEQHVIKVHGKQEPKTKVRL